MNQAPDLDTARAELAEAEHAIVLAHDALASTRERFLEAPSPELDAEVESADFALRRAERLKAARQFKINSVQELLDAADKERAIQDLQHASDVRGQLRSELAQAFREGQQLFTAASQLTVHIEDLIYRDKQTCLAANAAALRAGVEGEARPIVLDDARRAFAIALKRGPMPKLTGDPDIGPLLAKMSSPATVPSLAERAQILQLARLAIEAEDTGRWDTGLWFSPLYKPSARLFAGSAEDAKDQRARRLLAALTSPSQTEEP